MRITTVHDVFRSSVFGMSDLESPTGAWLHQFLLPHLTALGHAASRFSLVRDGSAAALTAAAEREGWPRNPTGWTWLCSHPDAREAVASLIAPLRDADLVIGFEMPPNMIRVLIEAGVRVVDLGQDPIRFCPDLFLRFRTNDPAIGTRLAAWETPDVAIATAADDLKARLGSRCREVHGVVFAGQMDVDASLIEGGTIARADAFIARIEQGLGDRPLLLKPHPMAPKSQDLLTLYEHFLNARFIDDNIYALLAQPGIEEILTLSSSVASEAAFFGKSATRLIEPDMLALPPEIVSRFYRIDNRAGSLAFWGNTLDGMPSFMFVETPPPPLRQRFSASWGYVRDMTEIVPRDVAEGELVSFAAGGRGQNLCLFGWSTPEPWGVWSDGEAALLQLVPPSGMEIFGVDITLMAFMPNAARPRHITIQPRAAGAGAVLSFEFSSSEIRTITIPITHLSRGEPIELLFHIRDAISPRESGLSADLRRLGVGLHSMKLRRSVSRSPR